MKLNLLILSIILMGCSSTKPTTVSVGSSVSVDSFLMEKPKVPGPLKDNPTPNDLMLQHRDDALLLGSAHTHIRALQDFICRAFPLSCEK
jgi:hypothetical protein